MLLVRDAAAGRSEALRARFGWLTGAFLIGYGIARITGECFREPDAFLGFLPFGTTMGQMLCIPMLIAGVWLIWRARPRRPVRPGAAAGPMTDGLTVRSAWTRSWRAPTPPITRPTIRSPTSPPSPEISQVFGELLGPVGGGDLGAAGAPATPCCWWRPARAAAP